MASGAQTRPLLTVLAQWARVPADDHHRYISDRRRVPTQLPEALRRKRFSSSPGKKRFHQKPEPLLSLRRTPKGQVLLETVSVAQGGCAAPGLSLRLPVPREPGVERPLSQVWGRRLAVSKETRIEETPQPQVAIADPKEQGGSRQVRAVAGRSGP